MESFLNGMPAAASLEAIRLGQASLGVKNYNQLLIFDQLMDSNPLQGEVPDGYFVAKSTSWTNWFIARGFLKDGKPDFSSKLFRDGLKIYPLSKADNQPTMEFYNASGKAFNTIHPN